MTDAGLYHNRNITDNGLRYLVGIMKLNLNMNRKITDNGLKYLKSIKRLKVYCNTNITKNGVDNLHGCLLDNSKLGYKKLI
jgi:methylthioribose-1-phosphate isomerase